MGIKGGGIASNLLLDRAIGREMGYFCVGRKAPDLPEKEHRARRRETRESLAPSTIINRRRDGAALRWSWLSEQLFRIDRWTSNCSASSAKVRSPLTAASATFALNAGVWFRRGRLLMLSADSRNTACPGYCYGLHSERRLTQEVELHLAYRWFCRLDLDEGSASLDLLGEPAASIPGKRCLLPHIRARRCGLYVGRLGQGRWIYRGRERNGGERSSRYHGKVHDELDWTEKQLQKRAVAEYLAALEVEAEERCPR
jgi:Transposase domain (DUF772)